jgi:hypothetical protein
VRPGPGYNAIMQRPFLLGLLGCALILGGCGQREPPKPRFIRLVKWHGKGVWLKADLHIHTKFSDGTHTVDEVVRKGKQFGCHVLAITDHADRNRLAATREYFEAIEAARRQYPDMILFAGLEWNVPPWGGDEHATLLIDPELDEWNVLSRFKDQFDDADRSPHPPELAEEALRWLEVNAVSRRAKPVVIYEHPGRKRERSRDVARDIIGWRKINDMVIGMAGAPGHQRAKIIGSFRYKEKTVDRWDPAVARIGDAWDEMLAAGLDVWAAHAPSDFHNNDPTDLHDYWPGEFSETWLHAPENSPAGVLQALRAGTFFAAHGHIVREAELTAEAPGLPRAAGVGEVIELLPGTPVVVKLHCVVPPKDWRGRVNHLAEVELIGITRNSARSLDSVFVDDTGEVRFETLEVPPGGIVLRARGRRIMPSGTNLLFYTNSIRIKTPD